MRTRNASRSQYKPVRCCCCCCYWQWVEWEDWTWGKTHTKVDSMMFSRVIYICNARAQNFTKCQRKLALRFSIPLPPNPPLSKYLASAFWAVLNRWLDASGGGNRGEKAEEKSCGTSVASLEKLLAPVGSLDCLLGLWYEESRQAQLVPRWYCSCWVCMCVSEYPVMCGPKAGNYDNAKVCQVANHKEYDK